MTIPYPSLDTGHGGHSGLHMASSYHYSMGQHKPPAPSSLPSPHPPGPLYQAPVTPERLCLPPPSPGLYPVTHHSAPATSAPPTPVSGAHGGYGGFSHKGEAPRKPGGADHQHLQQHHHHQHQSYQAFNNFSHSAGWVQKKVKTLGIQLARCISSFTRQSICKFQKQAILSIEGFTNS